MFRDLHKSAQTQTLRVLASLVTLASTAPYGCMFRTNSNITKFVQASHGIPMSLLTQEHVVTRQLVLYGEHKCGESPPKRMVVPVDDHF